MMNQDNEIMTNKYDMSGGTFGVGVNEGDIKGNAKIGGVINEGVSLQSPEKTAEIATILQNLLDYFETENPPTNFNFPEAQKQVKTLIENNPEILEGEIVKEVVENTPNLKQRIGKAGEAAYLETLKMIFPPINIAIEAVKAFKEAK